MHREVQIKHDLMTHKCKYTLMALRHETSGLCEKTNSIYIVFIKNKFQSELSL